ncbi:high affinity immunoglobulin epsilon receptor subunit alpha [Trichechus manatus latirostris]|uniref:high affinity immunoglobulin epsilon receptor subunit alpha n=1 Tax=Trichechus manatus latirostris TaxID=127582 RepID=UPI000CA05F73|nr:high affinity immunoglobulin epsilon receptor subunit alpha [Trichechus manatus latirostris]
MPAAVGSRALLWIALLLFAPAGSLVATGKSTIFLNPPWNRIFKGENVTLTCDGGMSLEVNSTRWLHNGTVLSETTSSLNIVNAGMQDSGEYICQNQRHNPSKPVFLEVFSDWLLLQVSTEVVTEGQPFLIRCHSWKNLKAYKVIYYKDGEALQYWYENHNISIPKATLKDNGTYHCEGFVQKLHRISDSLNITVQEAEQIKNYWPQFFIPLLVGILFTVDTALFFFTRQQFKLLLKIKRTRRGSRLLDPQPKTDPQKK